MAIYHFSVKPIGRGMGRSAVAAASYRSGERIRNEYDSITHDYTKRRGAVGSSAYRSGDKLHDSEIIYDYTRKQDIVHSEIMLPAHAPSEYFDRSTLWNNVEKCEKARNARTAREVVVALPNELSQEQNIELVLDYVQRNFVEKGMCADINIHAGHIHERKGEQYPFENLTIQQENPHAHIMLTVRPINQDGSWGRNVKKNIFWTETAIESS
jgi:ATP-dependent exoDNAse (exonuclease V) alpha subunit